MALLPHCYRPRPGRKNARHEHTVFPTALPPLRYPVLGHVRKAGASGQVRRGAGPAAPEAEEGAATKTMSRPLVPMKRPPGRPMKDGSRARARMIAQKKVDRRTRPAKLRQQAANLLAEDAGGWPNLNNREVALIWTTASVWVLLNLRLDALLTGDATEDQGSLKWMVALLNSFRATSKCSACARTRASECRPCRSIWNSAPRRFRATNTTRRRATAQCPPSTRQKTREVCETHEPDAHRVDGFSRFGRRYRVS